MHAFTKIKTVRALTLYAGIERQYIAAQFTPAILQIIQQRLTNALAALRFIGDQIIDV